MGAKVIADSFPVTAILNHKSYKIDANGKVEMQENADRTGIKVGDYINFEPDTDQDAEGNLIAKKYSKEYLSKKYTGNTDSSRNNEDLIQEKIKWQVLKIYEDGSLKLIGSATDNKFQEQGPIGYNNFVWLLNDICEQLYSKKSAGITARNVNIEDFEDEDYYISETKGNWKKAKDNYINEKITARKQELINESNYIDDVDTMNKTVTYKKESSYYPYIYQYENGSGVDSKNVKVNGITQSDRFMTSREQLYKQNEENSRKQANRYLTTQYSNYLIDINEQNYGDAYKLLKNESGYTLASRFVDCTSKYAAFGVSIVLGEKRYFAARDISMSRTWIWL